MRELGGDLGLALESLDELLVLGQGIEQDLDGHHPVDADLLGLVDRPHRPLAQPVQDLVAGNLELAGAFTLFLQQANHLAARQHLGVDHDLQQAGRGVFVLGGELCSVILASLDLTRGGQAPAEDRFFQVGLVEAGESLEIFPGRVAVDRGGHAAVSALPGP